MHLTFLPREQEYVHMDIFHGFTPKEQQTNYHQWNILITL